MLQSEWELFPFAVVPARRLQYQRHDSEKTHAGVPGLAIAAPRAIDISSELFRLGRVQRVARQCRLAASHMFHGGSASGGPRCRQIESRRGWTVLFCLLVRAFGGSGRDSGLLQNGRCKRWKRAGVDAHTPPYPGRRMDPRMRLAGLGNGLDGLRGSRQQQHDDLSAFFLARRQAPHRWCIKQGAQHSGMQQEHNAQAARTPGKIEIP